MSTKGFRPPPVRAGLTPNLSQRLVVAFCISLGLVIVLGYQLRVSSGHRAQRIPSNADQILRRCTALKDVPRVPNDFHKRHESDRYEVGTRATLIKNATIWTGMANGTEIMYGDILLDKGLVKHIGVIPQSLLAHAFNLTVVHANGAWVTPGLVDLHSHLGVSSVPILQGAIDYNSPHGPIAPWLRSIDGLNTHDDAYRLTVGGGVTSAQVLPGSGNAIGGQAFVIKLRKTKENSASAMVVEPPHQLDGNATNSGLPLRWRHLKQACGENLREYGTRMDTSWAMRSAYNEARKIKESQDEYCQDAMAGRWDSLEGPFPESLEWEMLVDVLRGRVKISNHCYEAVDLDAIVRLTNEFQFHLASFHHADEAWLVPDLLKRVWGGPPVVAMFAILSRYKREAYRGSEFAPAILASNDIPVVMKSDHPVLNSRYLMFEAQQAHYYGLPSHRAMTSVTSVPAAAAGLDHRIGVLRVGADADVVLWDSHPLHLGATPIQVWIDGMQQIPSQSPETGRNEEMAGKAKEGSKWASVPQVPNWDAEQRKAIESDGIPPFEKRVITGKVVFRNVTEVWTKSADGEIEEIVSEHSDSNEDTAKVVVVEKGAIICLGTAKTCLPDSLKGIYTEVDLHGGSISPGFMSFGSSLGLGEMIFEPSTGRGDMPDPTSYNGELLRAADALMFQTRNALYAYQSGVTHATSSLYVPPSFSGSSAGLIHGFSATFRTGGKNALDKGALIQDMTALHVAVGRLNVEGDVSVSAQIALLRKHLLGVKDNDTQTAYWFEKSSEGAVPLVVEVGGADVMSTLLLLKEEVEKIKGSKMKMIFSGATEAHLVAEEISKAGVGVILDPVRPFPLIWENRRILPGPPLSDETTVAVLLAHNVTVGLGVGEASVARNARFEATWASLVSNGRINRRRAYELASTNLEKMLEIPSVLDLVAYDGGNAFELSSKVAAVLSPQRGVVDILRDS